MINIFINSALIINWISAFLFSAHFSLFLRRVPTSIRSKDQTLRFSQLFHHCTKFWSFVSLNETLILFQSFLSLNCFLLSLILLLLLNFFFHFSSDLPQFKRNVWHNSLTQQLTTSAFFKSGNWSMINY